MKKTPIFILFLFLFLSTSFVLASTTKQENTLENKPINNAENVLETIGDSQYIGQIQEAGNETGIDFDWNLDLDFKGHLVIGVSVATLIIVAIIVWIVIRKNK